jgi:alpha-mannosidase
MNIFNSGLGVASHYGRSSYYSVCYALIGALIGELWPQIVPAAEVVPQQVLIIPHTHWEGAVFETREEYLDHDLTNIVKALDLLKRYPDYRFVLDQMCYVRPFLERYPSEIGDFRRFLSEGRLQIVGGTDVMNDTNVPSGESIARQYLFAKSYFRERLGYEVTTGWAIDTFGHNAQMPQILKLAGIKSYWFQRGVPGIDTPSEFLWQGIDGTQIGAFWLPFGYGLAYELPASEIEFDDALRKRFESLTPFSRGAERVMLAGRDVSEPEESLPVMLDQFNRSGHAPFRAQFAVPTDFETLVAKRANRPVVRGELNPVFQGAYSSRIEMKQSTRELERLLTTAEKLSVIASAAGVTSDPATIEQAWEPVLFNQEHDPSAGTIIDAVYEDAVRGYERARGVAREEIRRESEAILAHVDTSGSGVPVVVFNTLGWRRTDVAEADISFSDAGVHGFAIFDNDGQAVPVQFLDIFPWNGELNVPRYGDGGIRRARVAFIARDVPALGYAVYHVVPDTKPPAGPTIHRSIHEDRATVENEFYRASFDFWTGDMTGLSLKESNWQVLAGPGNVVAREYDGGDLWELYGPLNGGRFTAMTKPITPPRPAYTQWSSDFVGGSGQSISGPVFSEFSITHPLGKNPFSSRVRLYNGLRRIDIRTEITNQEEYVRYRAVFPTTVSNGVAMHEIAFGAIERPRDQEFPAQNWIDYSDGHHGVTLINRGIPGNNVSSHGQMMLSLARSAHVGIYYPGMDIGPSDTGLEMGRKFTLEYALVPHMGDWRSVAAWRTGLEFNHPLIVQMASAHGGELPSKWGLLEVSQGDVVVSALKPGKDGTAVLRVYEAAGKASHAVHVSFHSGISRIHESNLIEDPGAEIQPTANGFTFDLRPFEIKTFTLEIEPTTSTRK